MSAYILMRSNKQSGPFSKEELLQLGLKPYDLIWIEGKSALWRYPSEVPELKEYAAAVEEQPYDRFYKKKTEEQKEPEFSAFSVKKERETATMNMNNGHISVIMPKQAAPPKKETPAFVPAPAPVNTIADRTLEVETKYSQPLDEIKERYVKQLQQRKHKTAERKMILQVVKNAAVFAAIIGSGILIGFIIKPKHAPKNNTLNPPLQNLSPVTTESSAKEEPISENNNNTGAAKINGTIQLPVNNNNEVKDNGAGSLSIPVTDNKSSNIEKNKESGESLITGASSQNTINTANGERHKNTRNSNNENETIEKPSGQLTMVTGDIATLVSVKANNYKLRNLGGFRNLELTVTNDSKFTLDNVLVELQYLNINEQPVKVEHIRFQSIEPGGLLSIRVPDNNRGAKLIYKIIKIEPKS